MTGKAAADNAATIDKDGKLSKARLHEQMTEDIARTLECKPPTGCSSGAWRWKMWIA
jgi:hypothetical protein